MSIFIAIAIFLTVMRQIENSPIGLGSLRVYMMIVVHILALSLARLSYHRASKLILIFSSPVIILVFPTVVGFVEEESITYYSYVVIAFSLIPQLICDVKSERVLYWSSMLFYLILLIIIEPMIFLFSPNDYQIFQILHTFYIYHRVPQFAIFLFLNFSVYYLKTLNTKYELALSKSRIQLNAKANQLQDLNKRLDDQNQELKKVNEEIKKMQVQLIQSEKMASLGTLIAGVAHEVNNPLNAIYGGLQLLQELAGSIQTKNEDDKKDCDNALYMIENGFERANHIVQSLLTFSYKGVAKKEMFDIHDIIDSTLLFLNQKKPRSVTVVKNYQLLDLVPMYTDKIHQVILNLIDNAYYALGELDHDTTDLWLKISTTRDNGTVIAKFENNGPHIENNNIKNIFDPFFTTKEPGKGTGLGLAISYNLVDEHEGNLVVHNTDPGVCFDLILPLEKNIE